MFPCQPLLSCSVLCVSEASSHRCCLPGALLFVYLCCLMREHLLAVLWAEKFIIVTMRLWVGVAQYQRCLVWVYVAVFLGVLFASLCCTAAAQQYSARLPPSRTQEGVL